MVWLQATAIALAALVIPALAARAQTFDFTAQQLRERFNEAAVKDNADTIKVCRSSANAVLCIMDDARFQEQVKLFKKLDLANGNFELNEKLMMTIDKGKVQTMTLAGDRETPMGLFHLIATLGNLFVALKPGMNNGEVKVLTDKLGLMRGDDDPTIGQKRMEITPFAEISCNNNHSSKTLAIGCVFIPRF
jgi:hypothetical protein